MGNRLLEKSNILKKYSHLITAGIMAFLPLLCCMIACAARGAGIADVSIAAGEWNDELFYFKQVEGIVNYGYPLGYFGFNESHAQVASFAAWSPVLVFPWILWGLVFGWTLSSPVYCNIVLMMVAVFVFVWLVKPQRKQLGILTVLFVTFTPLTRYMLSGMPECICFSMVILFFSLAVSYQQKEHKAKMVLMLLLASVMTLMRPYLLLFFLFPCFYLIRKRKWVGVLESAAAVGVTGAVYVLVKHYFGAEYFTPLFDVTWVTTFLDKGIFAGIKYVGWRLVYHGLDFFRLLIEGFRSDLFWGEYFAAFIVVLAVILLYTVSLLSKKRRKERSAELILSLWLSVCFVGMWAALLLMYKMKEGSKHLLTFIVLGIFAVSLMKSRYFKKMAAVACVFAVVFVLSGTDPYEHEIPFGTEELAQREAYWQEVFDRECVLRKENVPNFDNVMIWIFNDKVGEEYVLTPYQMLYQLPEGYGISCCYAEYVKENIGDLKSRYLAVAAGGEIDALCESKGLEQIGRDEGLVVYELRK